MGAINKTALQKALTGITISFRFARVSMAIISTVITDEIDPLQSEGMALVDKLKAAGVKTDSKNYDGVTHEFFGMGAVVPQAKDAEMYAVSQLKAAFAGK